MIKREWRVSKGVWVREKLGFLVFIEKEGFCFLLSFLRNENFLNIVRVFRSWEILKLYIVGKIL